MLKSSGFKSKPYLGSTRRVDGLVKAMGSELTYASSDDTGTRFAFELPVTPRQRKGH